MIAQLKNPSIALALAATMSIVALTGALIGQFAFDLPPCIMCIYQRIPFAAVIMMAIIGWAVKPARLISLALSGIAFAINAGLALYHTGIEQYWWSETQGCRISFDTQGGDIASLMERISSAQASSCADIPWSDPILNLSMANYNALLCAGLAAYVVYVLWAHFKKG